MTLNIKHADGSVTLSISEADARERFPAAEVDAAVAEARAEQARLLASQKINGAYPLWKQMNVMLSGTDAERQQMSAFISAVRAWSNQAEPNLAALEAIQP